MFNANELRVYNYNSDGDTVSYSDYATSSFVKNLRLGTSFGLVDKRFFSTTLNMGLYQGAYTDGLDLDILLLKLNIATYEEEIGDSTTSIADRRYTVKLALGW
jgi:hypothetical protein